MCRYWKDIEMAKIKATEFHLDTDRVIYPRNLNAVDLGSAFGGMIVGMILGVGILLALF